MARAATTPRTTDILAADATCDKVTPGTARLAFEVDDRKVTLYVPKGKFGGDVPAEGEGGFEIIVRRKAA